MLEPIETSAPLQIFPTNSLNDSSLEFVLETDRNIFIDLTEMYLQLKVRVTSSTGNLDPASADDDVCLVNNGMHSLFSNCQVYFNSELVYSSNGLYAHKAFLSTEVSGTKGTKECISSYHGYTYEFEPDDLTR